MEPRLAKKLYSSLIQLIIGILLVGVAGWYLSNHPAEWQSIKSSITTVRQKITKLVGVARNDSASVLAQTQKQQAVNSLQEIINTIKSCNPDNGLLITYQRLYDTITTSSIEEFARMSSTYYSQISDAYQIMQQLCNTVPKTLDE